MLHDGCSYTIPALFNVLFYRGLTEWRCDSAGFRRGRITRQENDGTVYVVPRRDQFLSLKSDGDILQWLNETGALSPAFRTISRDQFRRLQDLFIKFMEHDVRKVMRWLEHREQDIVTQALERAVTGDETHFDFDIDAAEAWVIVIARSSLTAMVAETTLQKLEGTKFAKCHFRNCPRNRVYVMESEHERKYCSPECARADGQRRRRAAKPKQAA